METVARRHWLKRLQLSVEEKGTLKLSLNPAQPAWLDRKDLTRAKLGWLTRIFGARGEENCCNLRQKHVPGKCQLLFEGGLVEG